MLTRYSCRLLAAAFLFNWWYQWVQEFVWRAHIRNTAIHYFFIQDQKLICSCGFGANNCSVCSTNHEVHDISILARHEPSLIQNLRKSVDCWAALRLDQKQCNITSFQIPLIDSNNISQFSFLLLLIEFFIWSGVTPNKCELLLIALHFIR